jgi:photosystem II stability/assembly factor-like uncharacterized protein
MKLSHLFKISLPIIMAFQSFGQNGNCWQPTNGPYGGHCKILKSINNTLYAGTDCGIYTTTNNGLTWNHRCAGLGDCKEVQDIDMVGSILIAGTLDSGIYISNDSGNNWIQSNSGLSNNPFLDLHIYDIFVNGTDILIGTANGVFKSTNQGNTWFPSNIGITSPTNINANRIAKNGSTLILSTLNGIYKSIDNGFTWINLNVSFSYYSPSLVSISGSIYILGSQGIYKSNDNGTSWTLLTTNLSSIPSMLFESGGKLYCSSNIGSYVSTNGGSVWSFISSKAFSTVVENNNVVFGGNLDGVLSWNVGSNTVKNSGLGSSSITNDIYRDGNIIYVASDNGLYSTSDDGNTWLYLSSNLPLNSIVTCINKSGNNLIIGTKGNGVFISSNQGNTWISSNLGLTISGTNYSEITSIFTHNGRVFLGAKENMLFYNYASLFISDNDGQSWTQSSNGLSQNAFIRSICKYNQYILLGTNSGVYLSPDNGINWFFDGLSDPIMEISSNSYGYFASNSDIIHYTSDLGNTWTSYDFDSGSNFSLIRSISNINDVMYVVRDISVHSLVNGNWTLMPSGCLSGGKHKGLIANSSGTLFLGSNSIYEYGNYYYSVNNGVSKFTGQTNSINEVHNEKPITIKPNPVQDELCITSKKLYENSFYSIFNILGDVVMTGELTANEEYINCKELQTGIYFLQIGETNSTIKFIKN